MKIKDLLNQLNESIVAYHGTNADFDSFDVRKLGSNTDMGMRGAGIYFTPHKETPKVMAQELYQPN